MTPIGIVWETLQEAMRLYSDDDLSQLKKRTNAAYFRLCEMADWQRTRRSVSITAAGSTDGVLLPADLIGVLAVRDSDFYEYQPCDEQDMGADYPYPRRSYAFRQAAVEPLYAGKAFTIAKDSATFSATPAVTAAMVGEYMRFDTDPGYYKIVSTTTLATTYRGPDIQSKVYVVRPATARRIILYDDAGALASGTFTVHYWAYPEPLWQEWQLPVIPSVRALELLVTIDALGTKEKQEKTADNYRAEFREELSRMRNMNPRFVAPKAAMGNDGYRVGFFGWK